MSNINDTSSVAGDTADRLRQHAGDAADALKGVGSKASSDINEKAAGLVGTAKGMASDAGDKVNESLEGQKAAGAERVKSISGAIRRAADELEPELPPAAAYIRRAADEIDQLADAVQRRDVRQLVGDVQSFARRQPAAFLGATVLGGFAVMRLLKAPTASHTDVSTNPSSSKATSLVPVDTASHRDNAYYAAGSGEAAGSRNTAGLAGGEMGQATKAGRS